MTGFQPRDAKFLERVTESFARQPFSGFIGCELRRVEPGVVDIALPFRSELAQQHGYVHGGVVTSIADAAAGFAAMTLVGPDIDVLTAELKVNFLRPAGSADLFAKARVIKPGRTLIVVQADVIEQNSDGSKHVLTGLVTVMAVDGR